MSIESFGYGNSQNPLDKVNPDFSLPDPVDLSAGNTTTPIDELPKPVWLAPEADWQAFAADGLPMADDPFKRIG